MKNIINTEKKTWVMPEFTNLGMENTNVGLVPYTTEHHSIATISFFS
jgi:hypothetical protein